MHKADKLIVNIERTEALDQPAERINGIAGNLFRRLGDERKVRDFLHGVWLGHPLHAVVVALPIGAWTMAGVIDLLTLPKRSSTRAATFRVGAGTLGAMRAAPAGLADCTQMSDRQRRVGLVHLRLNSISTPLFLLSFLRRITGHGGKRLSFLGLGITTASAYIGGEMVYRLQAG